MKTYDKFVISEEDFDAINEDSFIRLMDCLNFKVHDDTFAFDSLDYTIYKDKGSRIIHWLPVQTD